MTSNKNPESPKEKNSPTSNDKSKDEEYIGDFHSAPHYMQDNDKIHSGYRINFRSKRRLLKSLFMVHNESVNIWSHLVPLCIFLCLLISLMMVIDDHQFKKQMSFSMQDIDRVYNQYEMSIRNLTLVSTSRNQSQDGINKQSIASTIVQNYHDVVHKIDKHTEYLNMLLKDNIQGIKSSLKQQLKDKLKEIQKFKEKYQNTIVPNIVSAFENQFNFTFINHIQNHAQTLKKYIDSNVFMVMDLHPEVPNPQLISKWPIFVFMTSAVLCLLFSTLFHLFHPLSSNTYGLLLRFDFAGISLLIAGSSFPPFYYSFYCHFAVVEIYLTSIVVVALSCFVISLFEWIHRHQNIKYRAIVFGTFGFSMWIPLIHLGVNQFIFDNFGDPFKFSSSYVYYISLISCYMAGLFIFAKKCPERNNPGKYDICGHSHQIWHFLVVSGIVLTYFGVLHNYEMRKESICPI